MKNTIPDTPEKLEQRKHIHALIKKTFGKLSQLAKVLDVNKTTVLIWLNHKRIPQKRAEQISRITNGKIQASEIMLCDT